MFLFILLFSFSRPNQEFKKYPNPKAWPWKFRKQRLRSNHYRWWQWLSEEKPRRLGHGSSESRGNGSSVWVDFPRLEPLPPLPETFAAWSLHHNLNGGIWVREIWVRGGCRSGFVVASLFLSLDQIKDSKNTQTQRLGHGSLESRGWDRTTTDGGNDCQRKSQGGSAMEVQRAEGMEVQYESISLTWRLCHCCLKPSLLGAFIAIWVEGFGLGRSGFVGVADLGLLLLHYLWVGCCFVVFLALPFFVFLGCWFASFFSFLVCFLLRSFGKSGLLGNSWL